MNAWNETPSHTRLERDRLRSDNQRLRSQNAEQRRLIEILTGLPQIIPPIYAHNLTVLYFAATSKPSNGETEATLHHKPSSSPPPHNPVAYNQLETERRHLRYRADRLETQLVELGIMERGTLTA